MGLVLSRRIGESIQIGSDVTITVVRFSGPVDGAASTVSLLFDAPKDIEITRTNNRTTVGRRVHYTEQKLEEL